MATMDQAYPKPHVNKGCAVCPITPTQSGLIALDFNKLLLLFVIGSVLGLVLEVVYHAFLFGGYESRAGLVWGPFSPLYGTGAVVLTLILNRLWHYPAWIIIGTSMIIGTVVEFATSWGMEYFFGAVAWDYSGTFGNIQGRVNLLYACLWGVLGLAWVRLVMPLINEGFKRIDWQSAFSKASGIVLTFFLAVNIIVTVQALNRESDRANGLPAVSQVDQFYDEYFPSSWMQGRFENMSVYGKVA